MEIKGKVTHHMAEQSGTSKAGKAWSKGGFVIETNDDKFPKSVALETFGDKVELPAIGAVVTAHINLESREWNGKWYSNIQCWKVDIDQPAPRREGVTVKQVADAFGADTGAMAMPEDDDLPFAK
jgi:hypothetical protein